MYAQILGRAVLHALREQFHLTFSALRSTAHCVRGPFRPMPTRPSLRIPIQCEAPCPSHYHSFLLYSQYLYIFHRLQFIISLTPCFTLTHNCSKELTISSFFFFGFFFIWVQGKCIPIGVFRIHLRSPSIQAIKSHATLFFFSKNTYCQKYVFLSFYIKRRRFLLRPPLRVKKLLLFWFYIPF